MFAKIRIVDTVFEKVCQMLHTRFYQSDTQLSVSTVKKLLLLLSKADRSLVEVRHRKWIDSPLVLKLIFFTQHKWVGLSCTAGGIISLVPRPIRGLGTRLEE